MKPRNATTAVNLIDLHLRRVLSIPAAYGQTALAAAGTVRLEYPGTIEKALTMRLFWAARRGDTVAETLAAPGRFDLVAALIAARDALVFATVKQGARVEKKGVGLVLDGNEIQAAPGFFWDAIEAIDARGIRDDASLFDLFNVIDAAVNSRHRVAPEMQTLARAIVKSAARARELGQERKPGLLKVISRRQIHAYWRFLQARERYVHTGAISPETRAWLVDYARRYGVAINQEG